MTARIAKEKRDGHGSVGQEVIGVGVGAIVFDCDGRILLLHRSQGPLSGWTIPGGAVEFGEDPQDAIERELEEEAGLRATSCAFLTYVNLRFHSQHWISLAFRVDEYLPCSSPEGGEPFDQAQWFSLAELPELDIIARQTLGALDLRSVLLASSQRRS